MTAFRGATRQALARLLDEHATHSIIDGLYTRYEVAPLSPSTNPNKLRKTNHLVQKLADRGAGDDFAALVAYVSTSASGMSSAFRRGSAESLDFYENFDRDAQQKTHTPTAATPRPERTFARPGSSAPPPQPPKASKRYVFVVRGRDAEAYRALSSLLTALDLRVISWDDATTRAGGGTPHTLEIVRAGIDLADAVIVLMTPDDLAYVKADFYDPVRDDPREARETGQARQNVIFEAGWAMALGQEKVILVRVGDVRPLSDIDGLNYVWLTNDVDSRRQLITRLRNCDVEVHDNHDRWREAGIFPTR
ncbi:MULTISPECIES: TIR domain-containing protein [Microbacterium]|uniref:TIR domain-containing protein n=1 Tax=Microbacterium TaxID=33882 RepID=UPI000A6C76C4|nr:MULTISPECIES: nucleotide-binding protein [unclassified Microbacterium]